MACYGKGNPVTKQEAEQMWKRMLPDLKAGVPIENMWDRVNADLYGGMGKSQWIGDILSGKKTPYKALAGKMWKAQYESRIAQSAASNATRTAAMGPIGRAFATAINLPRTLATLGHGVVFPVTHAGDLFFRPFAGSAIPYASLMKGIIKTYKTGIPGSGFFGAKGYIGRELAIAEHDPMYGLARDSGLDIGPNSHPTGILGGTKPLPSQRAWDALGIMRLDLWKRVMQRNLKAGMSQAEQAELGKVVADWSNHATGSGKGPIANLGGNILFGPKLTQAKLNKVLPWKDPLVASKAALRVMGDKYNGRPVSAADWASAQLRLSGMVQNFATRAGFLMLNQAYLKATGDDRDVNMTDPNGKDGYLQFKGPLGTSWDIPGEISEIRIMAKMVQLSFMNKREMEQQYRTTNRFAAQGDLLQRYATSKLTPTIQHVREIAAGQNYRGEPLPSPLGSSDDETRRMRQLSPMEYAGEIGPIPLEGPAGYLSDELKSQGFSSLQANQIIKGLFLFAGGYTGLHGHADKD